MIMQLVKQFKFILKKSQKVMKNSSSKAQSAMEYLMTYGWSILIITIALVALFAFGLFKGSAIAGSSGCLAQSGYLCSSPTLSTNGVITALIGQDYSQLTITATACSNSSKSPSLSSFESVTPNIRINSGQEIQLSFQCNINNAALGSSFVGTLWIQYTSGSVSSQVAMLATVSLKSTLSSNSQTNYYVPITLSNDQSNSVTSNFQQMIYFNPTAYASNEMENLSNIEFTAAAPIGTSGSVPLYSWIESGASNTATNTVIWVNLGSNTMGVAGSGSNTLIIYMNFLSSNTPVTSGYTGYAPQLECGSGCFQTGYAQYDDGTSVFTNYWNFAGTTLPSGWQQTTGSGGVIVNNGITVDNNNAIQTTSSVFISGHDIADFYAGFSLLSSGCGGSFGIDIFSPNIRVCSETGVSIFYANLNPSGFSAPTFISPMTAGEYYTISLWNSTSNTIEASNNYESPIIIQNTLTVATPQPLHISSYSIAHWIRIRYYPPADVMPGFTFGSVS